MSRPRTIGAYPGWLVSLLTDFEADRHQRTLYFNSVREARAFQLELSGFRGTVRAEGAGDLWPATLASRTRRGPGFGDNGVSVVLYHADDSPTPKVTLT